MEVMSDREKLIELLKQIVIPYWAKLIADHLLANGVTFQEGQFGEKAESHELHPIFKEE